MDLDELQHAESYRDRVSTVTDKGARNWVYALKPHGKFYNYRNILAAFYLLVFFGIPFIKVNGMPFVMFNVLEGKFILFSKIFWPQDFYIFAIAMITFIIFIGIHRYLRQAFLRMGLSANHLYGTRLSSD
jgi:hypothetical protein